MKEENFCRRENALDNVVGEDIRQLENVLAEYRSIRNENDIQIEDLIKTNRLLKTNPDLIREAVLHTEDLDDPKDIQSHLKAKEAFLFWCIIFCEKVLFKRYPGKREGNRELIVHGTKRGVMASFETIRKRLNCYFELPEEERGTLYSALGYPSVKAFVYNMATKRTFDEFRKADEMIEIKIPEEQLEGLNEEEQQRLCERIIEENEKKGITVFKGRNGKLYTPRHVPGTFTNREDGESFDNPEALAETIETVEAEAQKLMDRHAIVSGVKSMIAYMVQAGMLTDLEEEFVRDVICGEVKAVDKFREWQKADTLPPEVCVSGDIYNFKRSILGRMKKVLNSKREWAALAEFIPGEKR